MGRHPMGERALSPAEKQRAYRARLRIRKVSPPVPRPAPGPLPTAPAPRSEVTFSARKWLNLEHLRITPDIVGTWMADRLAEDTALRGDLEVALRNLGQVLRAIHQVKLEESRTRIRG